MPAPPATARLAFREMTSDDLDDMAGLLGDPQVMRYYPRPHSREQASAWIAWSQRLYRDHGFGLWLLTLRNGGEFVGDCGLTPQQVDGVTEIEVGYHLRTGLQGRGLATEAAAACRDYARDVLGLERLIAIIDPRNRPSQRVAEKLGLVVERESDNHGRWSSPRRIYTMSWSGSRRGRSGVSLGEPPHGFWQRLGQSEPGVEGVDMEAGDGLDAVTSHGEHEQSRWGGDRFDGVDEVAAEGGLGVGAGGQQLHQPVATVGERGA
jgi:RimJ/RimL family protein N-acetyltransferase